jgi:hypothetical protein
MADSSRKLVGSDITAAVSPESYPRFIKGGFQDYEGLWIKRSTADSKHVPSPRSRLLGNNVFERSSESSRIFGITRRFGEVLNLLKSAVEASELDEPLEQATIASRIGPKSKATKTVVRAATR